MNSDLSEFGNVRWAGSPNSLSRRLESGTKSIRELKSIASYLGLEVIDAGRREDDTAWVLVVEANEDGDETEVNGNRW